MTAPAYPPLATRPRLLDLCFKQGGASEGYRRAGFDVTAVDIEPQPRHRGGVFIQADALEVLRDRTFVGSFDAVHASWPCQGFKKGTLWSDKPDLVTPGRELMSTYDLPWVIENVMEAPLDKERSIVLCGGMFGLRTYRHRRFEPSPGLTLVAPAHQETPPDSPWYRLCPYCHYVGGLCPGREERAS